MQDERSESWSRRQGAGAAATVVLFLLGLWPLTYQPVTRILTAGLMLYT